MNIKFPLGFSQLEDFMDMAKIRWKHWMCCRDLSICRESLVVPHLTSNKYYFLIQWLLNKKLLWVKSWRRTFFVLFWGTICTFYLDFLYFFWATSPWQHWMSYFRFYIYKAIRKVLFLPFIRERSYKGLIFGCLWNLNVKRKYSSCHKS